MSRCFLSSFILLRYYSAIAAVATAECAYIKLACNLHVRVCLILCCYLELTDHCHLLFFSQYAFNDMQSFMVFFVALVVKNAV